MSEYSQSLLNRLNYHKSLNSSENAMKNLQYINPKLNELNIFALANLACNEGLSEEERKVFLECVRVKALTDYEMYSKEIAKLQSSQDMLRE
jgi:hypothetical protein